MDQLTENILTASLKAYMSAVSAADIAFANIAIRHGVSPEQVATEIINLHNLLIENTKEALRRGPIN